MHHLIRLKESPSKARFDPAYRYMALRGHKIRWEGQISTLLDF
jgi:hypothetical protein